MVSIRPAETALLVIDPQNAFCHPEGTLGQSGVDVTSMVEMVPRIAELVRLCRSHGIPDIWTRHYNFGTDAGRDAKRITPHTHKRKTIACQPGTWDSEFVSELASLVTDDTHVVVKHRWSAFFRTRLESLLGILGTRLMILCGSTSNACIETTSRDACMRDLDVVIVRDAIGGVRRDWHETAMAVWSHYVGEVVTLDDVRQMIAEGTHA